MNILARLRRRPTPPPVPLLAVPGETDAVRVQRYARRLRQGVPYHRLGIDGESFGALIRDVLNAAVLDTARANRRADDFTLDVAEHAGLAAAVEHLRVVEAAAREVLLADLQGGQTVALGRLALALDGDLEQLLHPAPRATPRTGSFAAEATS